MGPENERKLQAARRAQPHGRVEKQVALASGACVVFGREGYARAGIAAIAAEAGVSTRTLYNHFPGGKEQLFRAVVEWTSADVRDAQLALIDRLLSPERPPRPEDLERDLLAYARAAVGLMTEYSDHFALVRHIHAEAGHVPPAVLEGWMEAGPRRVSQALTAALAALAAHGLLTVYGDPARAAQHFAALAMTEVALRTSWGVRPAPPAETEEILASGVAAFLRAYRPRAA